MTYHVHIAFKNTTKNKCFKFHWIFLRERSEVVIHERHANLKYNYENRSFWAIGYFASAVDLNQKKEKYI